MNIFNISKVELLIRAALITVLLGSEAKRLVPGI